MKKKKDKKNLLSIRGKGKRKNGGYHNRGGHVVWDPSYLQGGGERSVLLRGELNWQHGERGRDKRGLVLHLSRIDLKKRTWGRGLQRRLINSRGT